VAGAIWQAGRERCGRSELLRRTTSCCVVIAPASAESRNATTPTPPRMWTATANLSPIACRVEHWGWSALARAGQRIDNFRKEDLIVVTLGASPEPADAPPNAHHRRNERWLRSPGWCGLPSPVLYRMFSTRG